MKNRKENGGSKSFTFIYSLSYRFIETYCDVLKNKERINR
jgi:hypothetical protein